MIPKAKSRGTTLGGNRFRYNISSLPRSKGVYALNIIVQSEEHNASKLIVSGLITHDYHVKPPKCHEDYAYLLTIIRSDVDGFIAEAIDNGWDYRVRGKDFQLKTSSEYIHFFPHCDDRLQWRNYPIGPQLE